MIVPSLACRAWTAESIKSSHAAEQPASAKSLSTGGRKFFHKADGTFFVGIFVTCGMLPPIGGKILDTCRCHFNKIVFSRMRQTFFFLCCSSRLSKRVGWNTAKHCTCEFECSHLQEPCSCPKGQHGPSKKSISNCKPGTLSDSRAVFPNILAQLKASKQTKPKVMCE